MIKKNQKKIEPPNVRARIVLICFPGTIYRNAPRRASVARRPTDARKHPGGGGVAHDDRKKKKKKQKTPEILGRTHKRQKPCINFL